MDHVIRFFSAIGPVFGVIFFVLAIGTVWLIVRLFRALRIETAIPTAFVSRFTQLVDGGQWGAAYDLAKADRAMLPRVVASGMAQLRFDDAREAMNGEVESIKNDVECQIAYLSAVGTLGPLLGLVGTVSGMIGAFRALGENNQPPNPAKLVDAALVVTLIGVAVSVPAIFFFTYFKMRLANNTHRVLEEADELLAIVHRRFGSDVGDERILCRPARPPRHAATLARDAIER